MEIIEMGIIANKENKTLGLALRICLIATWVMSCISVFVLMTGLKNIQTDGLDKDNVGVRLVRIVGDFGDKTTLYYVTFGMLIACLVLAVVSKYKTKTVSYIFKIVGLGISVIAMASGFEYISALRSCKGLPALSVTSTSKDAVAQALSSAGFSGNAAQTAGILTSKEQGSDLFGGYFFPLLILFILLITSIHCLVKKNDPNQKDG